MLPWSLVRVLNVTAGLLELLHLYRLAVIMVCVRARLPLKVCVGCLLLPFLASPFTPSDRCLAINAGFYVYLQSNKKPSEMITTVCCAHRKQRASQKGLALIWNDLLPTWAHPLECLLHVMSSFRPWLRFKRQPFFSCVLWSSLRDEAWAPPSSVI